MTMTESMKNFLRDLPKCEHHVHLEGTLEPDLLFHLAKRNNLTLPSGFPSTIEDLQYKYEHFKDLQDFLDLYYAGMSVLLTEQDFEDLAWAYLVKSHDQGLKHVEAFFDPQGHVERGVDMHCVIKGFNKALSRAENEFGMSTKLIMCILRHLPTKNSLETLKNFKPYYEKGWIDGLGMDSTEVGFPPELFEECYAYAKDNLPEGTLLTAHAGEEGDSSVVTRSVNRLNVSRIDHGIHSADDPEVMKMLADNDIMLTVCPLSNKRLNVVQEISEEPIRKFLEYGVPFSINCDDPAYFGGYILDNYMAVQEAFNFDMDTWITIAKNSVRGSILDTERKQVLYDSITDCYKRYADLED
ncbi:hypothetical protein FOA43_002354 [Brettanomyces nanus]|uniref:Adenine deaminase n=1 Tax=Eeniella nana TaxID=13502 RepID=A0A875S761_EENNA|nr:uncharacterized protein FOA43_002354 [Brettanomyces nanus]QPG75014.1 hypothetical protein FOA43_002354 [Brettanomyces nanus]